MARAEEQMERYQREIITLRRLNGADPDGAALYARTWAAFDAGFLMGAGLPEASATIAHLFRCAYPGVDFPVLWEGEA